VATAGLQFVKQQTLTRAVVFTGMSITITQTRRQHYGNLALWAGLIAVSAMLGLAVSWRAPGLE
jgi:uncharacterized membrane protein YadS